MAGSLNHLQRMTEGRAQKNIPAQSRWKRAKGSSKKSWPTAEEDFRSPGSDKWRGTEYNRVCCKRSSGNSWAVVLITTVIHFTPDTFQRYTKQHCMEAILQRCYLLLVLSFVDLFLFIALIFLNLYLLICFPRQ